MDIQILELNGLEATREIRAAEPGGQGRLGGHPKPAMDGHLKTGHRE